VRWEPITRQSFVFSSAQIVVCLRFSSLSGGAVYFPIYSMFIMLSCQCLVLLIAEVGVWRDVEEVEVGDVLRGLSAFD